MPTRKRTRLLATVLVLAAATATGVLLGSAPGSAPAAPRVTTRAAAPGNSIKALFVAGGCCHDYGAQMTALADGISKMANVQWTLVLGSGTNTTYMNPIFDNPDWAKGYDVVIHDECSADVKDVDYIRRVIKPTREGTPAVVLHCVMHTFRNASNAEEYREFLGVTAHEHETATILEIKPVPAQTKNPIMIGFPETFRTPVNDEMYIILKTWPNTTTLATGYGKMNNVDFPCIWTTTYGKGRVFGTTLGHDTAVVKTDVYTSLVARGMLWACDKLGDDGKPKPGYEAKP